MEFIDELKRIKQHMLSCWMVLGDFNMICRARDKSNNNINLRLMGKFRAAIDELELIDFPLFGRKFTWSNERENTTLTRINRVMVTSDWEALFPHFQLSPASTNVSDHCPLVLRRMDVSHCRAFRFENHWLRCPEFAEIVQGAWSKEVKSRDPIRVLHTKLSRTAKALKAWNKQKMRWTAFMSALASDVIFGLDLAEEERALTEAERGLRAQLKAKLLGFAAVDRARWRQKSRMTEIREGDASTRFFHQRASGRRRKNYIPHLSGADGPVFEHEGKAKILFDRFKNLIGAPFTRTARLNWVLLGLPRRDLSHLEGAFSEQELLAAIQETHGEKAPGPDGYTGAFFKHCWETIKTDMLAAVNSVHSLRGRCWHIINTANVVLLPKKEGAHDASDFRPISLMHSIPRARC
ncbi:uncharacterized protein [Aegilops tauschii subsp. strangulata]|uniref:uncharacterized protein n=1 Tax=Aegilops tauschii subsp. strangulata TaxID=200361 RepID=UPI003CC8BB23